MNYVLACTRNLSLAAALALAACNGDKNQTSGASSTGDGSSSTGSSSTSTSSSGTTEDPTTSGTTGSSSSTGAFFVPSDMSSPPQCDQWKQDCPEGQKCMPYSGDGDFSWESLKCVDVMPNPGQVGDDCMAEGGVSGIDNCDKGLMCWDVDPMTNVGVCVAMCVGSPDAPSCESNDASCLISNMGVLTLCLPKCDPLLPDACPGEVCLPNPQGEPGFACILDASEGMGTVNAPCAFANACNPGLLCVGAALGMQCDPNAGGCCQPYCDLSLGQQPDPNPVCDTQGGQFCLSVFDMGMAPPGHEDVGVCGIPQ